MIVHHSSSVDILILGAGWTSTFLVPLLEKKKVKFAATTTNGRDGTIPFKYDPDSDDKAPFEKLPTAKTVLITFPLKGKGQSKHLTTLYGSTHESQGQYNYIQLGATSLWNAPTWSDENTPIDKTNERGIAEDELISVARGCVLDLAGLYGGSRQPRNWVDRIIKTKDDLKAKGAVHLVHGNDVAQAILAVHEHFTPSKRWLLTDLRVYDWWDLIQDWTSAAIKAAEEGTLTDRDEIAKQKDRARWVRELMVENGVRALPREKLEVGRVLDARAFWNTFDIYPVEGRVR